MISFYSIVYAIDVVAEPRSRGMGLFGRFVGSSKSPSHTFQRTPVGDQPYFQVNGAIVNFQFSTSTMFSRIAVVALGLLAVVEGSVINQSNGDVPADSAAGRNLLHHARRVANNNNNNNGQQQNYNFDDADMSFLSGYSVKFQGCHHVQQWNENADDDEDVRIMTKRLVRFRLCPSSECSSSDLNGCSSHYGDYVVDMGTYVNSYYQALQNNQGGRMLSNNNNGFNVANYLECAAYNNRRNLQNNGNQYGYYGDDQVQYYIGPYCADQGGEIVLGLFTDDTCTSFAQSQTAIQGLPYTSKSLVSMSCTGCSAYNNGNGVSDFCTTIYEIAGKCESKMNVYYPNEAACSYIEGIKIIRADGVIRTSATKKSKAAAAAIGSFLTVAVLLAGYVYYLRTSKSSTPFGITSFDDETSSLTPLSFSLQSSAERRSTSTPPRRPWLKNHMQHQFHRGIL